MTEKINTSVEGTTESHQVIAKPKLTRQEEFTLLNLKSMLKKHIEYMNKFFEDISTEELPNGDMVQMIKYITNFSNIRREKWKYYYHFLREELNEVSLQLIKKKINTLQTDYYQYKLILFK